MFEARPGGVIGCRIPGIVAMVRGTADRISENAWNRAMDVGGCYPALPGAKWAQLVHEAPLRSLQLIPEPRDVGRFPPIFLWFHQDDVVATGEVAVPAGR